MSGPELPLVSVIVPVKDGARFLGAALDSAYRQTHRHIEVVVVDDGSVDGSAAIADASGAVVLRQPNRGPAAARNAAMAVCTGPIVAFLDADDTWPLDKLERQVGYLLAHPEVDGVLGRDEPVVEDGAPPILWLERRKAGFVRDSLPLATLVLWRRLVDLIGPYDESLRVGEDMDWMVRARAAGVRIDRLPEVVLHRRVHGANLSYRHEESRANLLAILRARARRDRA